MKKLLASLIVSATVAATLPLTSAFAAPETVGQPQILWQSVGTLSPAQGQTENIGVAGMLSGNYNGYIIAGGGANFPNGGPAVGGPKKTYSDVYVFKASKEGLTEVDHQQMPFEIAYGMSVTTKDGVYYIGGSTDAVGAKTITRLTTDAKGKLKIEKVGELPFKIQNGVAGYANGALYIGLGNQDGKASADFYKFNLKSKELTKLASFTGALREQSVSQILNNKLYVFGGGTNTALTDGYVYDIQKDAWDKVASVEVDNKAISVYGGNSIKLNEDEMLVIGGFNKEVYDWAVSNLGSLKDQELADFKAKYFGADVAEFKWNNQILVYNAKTNTWRSIGQIPFNAPCGEGLVYAGDSIISINGEVKPGVRSNRIYQGFIIK